MGFLRKLFGPKKPVNSPEGSDSSGHKTSRRRWSFIKSGKDKSRPTRPSHLNEFLPSTPFADGLDANKHAIAVAAATAAVAEAALAAARAAAEVVRLTNGGGGNIITGNAVSESNQRLVEEAAAVKIQSAFRGYLARRALRALKALVKLQALVRGHIVRKQTADMLRRMQTLVRLQARARASRAHVPYSVHSSNSWLPHHPVPACLDEHEHPLRAYSTKFDGSSVLKRCSSNSNFRNMDPETAQFGSNWLDQWMEESVWKPRQDTSLRNGDIDDEKSDKVLEVDSWKPQFKPGFFQAPCHVLASHCNNENYMAFDSPSKHSTKSLNQIPNLSSREVLSLSSLKFPKRKEEAVVRTTENSPQAFSTSSRPGSGSRRGPFTPTRSEYSWGFFSGYADHPNYMANTQSSRAKVRSQSAPKQRLEFDKYGSTRRSIQGLWGAMPHSDRDSDFRTKAYPASSRFNRLGSASLR